MAVAQVWGFSSRSSKDCVQVLSFLMQHFCHSSKDCVQVLSFLLQHFCHGRHVIIRLMNKRVEGFVDSFHMFIEFKMTGLYSKNNDYLALIIIFCMLLLITKLHYNNYKYIGKNNVT